MNIWQIRHLYWLAAVLPPSSSPCATPSCPGPWHSFRLVWFGWFCAFISLGLSKFSCSATFIFFSSFLGLFTIFINNFSFSKKTTERMCFFGKLVRLVWALLDFPHPLPFSPSLVSCPPVASSFVKTLTSMICLGSSQAYNGSY